MRVHTFAIVLALMISHAAVADLSNYYEQPVHGVEACEASLVNADTVAAGICVGYVMGIQTMVLASPEVSRVLGICLPPVSAGQLIRVFLKYTRDHPEEEHLGTSILLYKSWAGAFPCPSDQGE